MLLCSPQETLSRILDNLYFEKARIQLIRRVLTQEDIAVVRSEGRVSTTHPDSMIRPEPLIIQLAERNGWSVNRAIAEVGRRLEMISEAEFKDICEDIGERLPTPPEAAVASASPAAVCPSFSKSLILTYNGKSVQFQSRKLTSFLVRILQAFEDAGWQSEIPFISEVSRQEDMHEIRGRLNDRTSKIHLVFSVDVVRQVISWRRNDP